MTKRNKNKTNTNKTKLVLFTDRGSTMNYLQLPNTSTTGFGPYPEEFRMDTETQTETFLVSKDDIMRLLLNLLVSQTRDSHGEGIYKRNVFVVLCLFSYLSIGKYDTDER